MTRILSYDNRHCPLLSLANQKRERKKEERNESGKSKDFRNASDQAVNRDVIAIFHSERGSEMGEGRRGRFRCFVRKRTVKNRMGRRRGKGESGQINGSITIEASSYLAILAQYGPKSKVSRERDIEWRRPYVAF